MENDALMTLTRCSSVITRQTKQISIGKRRSWSLVVKQLINVSEETYGIHTKPVSSSSLINILDLQVLKLETRETMAGNR